MAGTVSAQAPGPAEGLPMPLAKLRCEIFPADLDRSVDFYVRVLGFALLRDERDTGEPYIYMQRGDVRVGALGHPGAVPESLRVPPVGVELVLEVDDLDAEHARIVATGWPLRDQLADRPWGLRDLRLLDPDGYYWRITTH
jgi:catechol 2,3-dioxygenase-like lactoylglutathione lyase family enzyme